jgi:4-amino-4-deoxy-L-arabinose transferase-like glycosyltransferase
MGVTARSYGLRLGRARVPVIVGLLAFFARLGFLTAYGIDASIVTWGDDHEYQRIAETFLAGGGWANDWYPPAYPLMLAGIYSLVGVTPVAARIVQAVLGALTAALTARLGAAVAGPRVGVAAGLIVAAYPGHVFMTWRLMAEVPFVLLVTAAVWFATIFQRNPSPAMGCLVGVTLGLSQSFKSNLILLAPGLFMFLLWKYRRTLRRTWQAYALMIVAFASAASLVALFNRAVTEGLEPLAGNAGHALWFSNNPLADGYFVNPRVDEGTQRWIEEKKLTERIAQAPHFEKDRLYGRLALLWIRDHPAEFLRLGFKKLDNSFGLFPRAAVFEGNLLARVVHFWSYGALLPFWVTGVLIGRKHHRLLGSLYVLLASYVVMVLIFYGSPRFTLAVLPALAVFAAIALERLLLRWWPRLAKRLEQLAEGPISDRRQGVTRTVDRQGRFDARWRDGPERRVVEPADTVPGSWAGPAPTRVKDSHVAITRLRRMRMARPNRA